MTDSTHPVHTKTSYNKEFPRIWAGHLSPLRLLIIIIMGIFMAEVVAMVIVYILGSLPYIQLTLIDAGVMTIMITPLLYFLSFQPLLRYIRKNQRAEEALLRSMSLQERFFDSIDTLIAYMDRDFNFIRVNEAYAKSDGRQPEYFVGRNHFDLYPHAENQAIFRRVVETGEAYSIYEKPFEYLGQPERGITYWNWSLLPVLVPNGEVEGVVLSLVDVTKRVRAEGKNRQLSRIVEQTADTVVVTDCDGVIEYVNPAFEQMTGYTKEEVFDKSPRVLKSGVHDDLFYQDLWRTILAGDVFQSEIANRKKNGELFYEVKTVTPLRDEWGDITHFVATGKDISEHKRIEAALNSERTRLKSILDTIPDGVYIINQDHKVEYTNPIIEREFGPVEGRKCYAYFHDLAEPCTWCVNEKVFAGTPSTGEHTYLKNNKSYEIFDSPLINPDGSISKLKLLHDITQRKKMELDLEQSNQGLLVANEAERKQRHLAEALVAAALVLNKSLDLDEVLTIILEQIRQVIPCRFADIGLLEGEAFYDASHQGDLDLPVTRMGVLKRFLLNDFPLLRNMCNSGEPVLIRDTEQEPAWTMVEDLDWCRSFLSAPLIVEKQVIGFVNLFAGEVSFYTEEMRDLLVAFASHAAVAIQNAWLFEQVRASSERLQSLSRRLVEVQEAERLYISRELHDEAGQMLTSLMLDLRLLEKKASQPDAILKKVSEMEGSLNEVIENLHNVAMALRPASLDHLGLVSALRQHVESVGEKYDLQTHFRSKSVVKRLKPNVETVLYRIVQEALTNVVRHARAAQVDVVLTVRENKLLVIIEDDGNGFNPEQVPPEGHLGLFGMRERVEMIDGKLVIESAPGEGTTIIVEVNYDDPDPDR